ncbi:MAG: DegT/DnrJ/EryC1/StrS family aminotransferase, partial [Candidatus Fimisoma sp.]|nr:DegT/DnrJ/EryC1/StrS family aminotransferase [Candidatus Fimisoma sp.]
FECSNTIKLCNTVLSLPMHPYLTDEDIEKVVHSLKSCL